MMDTKLIMNAEENGVNMEDCEESFFYVLTKCNLSGSAAFD